MILIPTSVEKYQFLIPQLKFHFSFMTYYLSQTCYKISSKNAVGSLGIHTIFNAAEEEKYLR